MVSNNFDLQAVVALVTPGSVKAMLTELVYASWSIIMLKQVQMLLSLGTTGESATLHQAMMSMLMSY